MYIWGLNQKVLSLLKCYIMTKKCFLLLFFTFSNLILFGQKNRTKVYGPFDPSVPTPRSFLGYNLGEYHTRHDRIVSYFRALAAASTRIKLEQYGETHEHRPLLIATISSPDNLTHLTEIQREHQAQINPEYNGKIKDLPLILYMGYNIHGNEPSSSEAAMWLAYTWVATQNDSLLEALKQTVIMVDPVINPDGRERHTQWVNSRRSQHLVADKYDAEHNEPWPKGRTNHYWFDLNRDLYLAVQPESRARLKLFHTWSPNVYTDFHEMGTSSTYFFEPKRPSALKHPITPKENHTTLNDIFKRAFAEEMDKVGDLYYTHEVFDATYPGYGSTYGDLQGGLALLFEQASSRGHIQETPTGVLRFEKTIFHQYLMSMTTIMTAVSHKNYMQDYQRRYFKEALQEAAKSRIKGYVFGDLQDVTRTLKFAQLLRRHGVEIRKSKENIVRFYVPLKQPQFRLIKHLFEDITQWRDSVFYDASAWTLVRAYNLPFHPVYQERISYEMVKDLDDFYPSTTFEKSDFAYMISWEDYYSPSVLYALQKEGIFTRLTLQSTTLKTGDKSKNFSRGTIIIAVGEQSDKMDKNRLYDRLQVLSRQYHVTIRPVRSGLAMKGIDLGSPNAPVLRLPKVALITGEGVNAYEAGEVWYLLDRKMDIEVTKIPLRIFPRVPLDRYNTLVMVSGNYASMNEANKSAIRDWISRGNTLITINNASQWAIQNHIAQESLLKRPKKDSGAIHRIPYANAPGDIGSKQVSGVILQVNLDTTHPLVYGYHQDKLAVYKKSGFWLKPGKNPYATPLLYDQHPVLSGYVSPQNRKDYLTKQPASVLINFRGSGKTILFSDDPLFRGTWLGTEKLFLNALFFGPQIRAFTGSRWWEEDH